MLDQPGYTLWFRGLRPFSVSHGHPQQACSPPCVLPLQQIPSAAAAAARILLGDIAKLKGDPETARGYYAAAGGLPGQLALARLSLQLDWDVDTALSAYDRVLEGGQGGDLTAVLLEVALTRALAGDVHGALEVYGRAFPPLPGVVDDRLRDSARMLAGGEGAFGDPLELAARSLPLLYHDRAR
jgi:hypothetical protein